MKRLSLLSCGVALFITAAAPVALGQEATERFVPIGQSPGQSGKLTALGTIDAVDVGVRSITVATNGGTVRMRWTERTRFWLDRSRQQLGTLKGAASDMLVGRRVEVRPDKNDRSLADWIKVEPTAP